MSEPEFELPPILALHEDHDFAAFDCGNAARNIWLRARALDNQVAGFSRVFAAVRDRRVIGFYALSAASILRSDLPAGLRRNAPDPLPMFLPGQLAVDLAWQKRALATRLILDAFQDAFQRMAQAAGHIGCRFLRRIACDSRIRRILPEV